MKAFIVSDVHGHYKEMRKALKQAGFDIKNPEHVFVLLGDLLDRGPDPKKCLKFVNSIPNDRKILIMGNHEQLMYEMLLRGYPITRDLYNKTVHTVIDYFDIDPKTITDYKDIFYDFLHCKDWETYFGSCIPYWEDDNNIFVHGWIPCNHHGVTDGNQPLGPQYTVRWRDGDWGLASWFNGMKLWSQGIKENGKTIWCGHWATEYMNAREGTGCLDYQTLALIYQKGIISKSQFDNCKKATCRPYVDDGIVAMDATTAFTGIVNCMTTDIHM